MSHEFIHSAPASWSEREHVIFEAPDAAVRLTLEEVQPGTGIQRRHAQEWEEILVFSANAETGGSLGGTYLCLPPGLPTPTETAETSPSRLLRTGYSARLAALGRYPDASLLAPEPCFKQTRLGELLWTEIPSRRPQDPGARIAELFRLNSGTRVTSLMDCRPGWILDDHDHPSDVLTFCIRGGGLLWIEDKVNLLKPSQLVVLPAGTRHRFQAAEQGAQLIIFVFEPFIA